MPRQYPRGKKGFADKKTWRRTDSDTTDSDTTIMAVLSNSMTWRSDEQILVQEWKRVSASLMHMRLDRSPFVPQNLQEYIEHKAEYATQAAEEQKERVEAQELWDLISKQQGRKPVTADLKEGSASELLGWNGKPTIWKPYWMPTKEHPLAPWPTADELKEEGDERHTSGFGRFLPVPRDPANETVTWKQRHFLVPYEMDKVRPVPKKYEVELPGGMAGEYDKPEPSVDNNGVYVDDEAESGRTGFADEFQSGGIRTPNNSNRELVLRSRSSTLASPMQMMGMPASSRRQVSQNTMIATNAGGFSFNPVVPEFKSQHEVGGQMMRHRAGSSQQYDIAQIMMPSHSKRVGIPRVATQPSFGTPGFGTQSTRFAPGPSVTQGFMNMSQGGNEHTLQTPLVSPTAQTVARLPGFQPQQQQYAGMRTFQSPHHQPQQSIVGRSMAKSVSYQGLQQQQQQHQPQQSLQLRRATAPERNLFSNPPYQPFDLTKPRKIEPGWRNRQDSTASSSTAPFRAGSSTAAGGSGNPSPVSFSSSSTGPFHAGGGFIAGGSSGIPSPSSHGSSAGTRAPIGQPSMRLFSKALDYDDDIFFSSLAITNPWEAEREAELERARSSSASSTISAKSKSSSKTSSAYNE